MEILFLITICTVIVIFSQVLYSNVGISFYVGTVGAGIVVDFGLCMVGMCMGDVVYN
tara:strand:- start:446 stop:616 length:171 start_codon:yes stop_codon:yes gene_type:complete